MKVTIMTCLPAKGDMQVNSGHVMNQKCVGLRLFVCPANLMNLSFRLLALCFLLNTSVLQAQQYPIRLINIERLPVAWSDSVHSDPESAVQSVTRLISGLHSEGFLEASADSVLADTHALLLWLHIGPRYSWFDIRMDEAPLLIRSKSTELPLKKGDPVSLPVFRKWAEEMLKQAENRGYPFARIQLDSAEVLENGQLSARVHVDLHTLFTMDSVQIWGDTVVSKNFLYNYLGFRPGDEYSEEIVSGIDRKLDQLDFLRRTDPTRVYFIYNKVLVVVRLAERKSSRFDGIVGFAPNSSNSNGSLLLTGELNLDVKNIFKNGSSAALFWRSFLQNSQELRLKAATPFIWKTPLGIETALDFTRFDTLFTDLEARIGFTYRLASGGSIGFMFQNRSTGLIGLDTLRIRNTRSLPAGNPSQTRMYGLQLRQSQINNLITPTRGYRFSWDVSVGNKQILRDIRIEALQFTNNNGESYGLYDSLESRVMQWSIGYSNEAYIPIRKRSALALQINGRHWISNRIFLNELYRFGGYSTLRGFDEAAFLASSYVIPAAELRYIFSENAWAGLFVNMAWYRREVFGNPGISDRPLGFGVNARIPAGNGLFNIAYALGTEQGNPIQFRSAKVHFGLVNYF